MGREKSVEDHDLMKKGREVDPRAAKMWIAFHPQRHVLDTLVQLYRVSQKECARLREGVPYVKVYRYNPKHLCPKLNDYGDNGQRSLKL